jgi:hypothetical protein
MQKAESLSFPRVLGSGGRGQSLLNEIFNGAERMRLCFVQHLSNKINSRAFQTK